MQLDRPDVPALVLVSERSPARIVLTRRKHSSLQYKCLPVLSRSDVFLATYSLSVPRLTAFPRDSIALDGHKLYVFTGPGCLPILLFGHNHLRIYQTCVRGEWTHMRPP